MALTSTEFQTLRLFARRVQELCERELYRSGGMKHLKFTFSFGSNEDEIQQVFTTMNEELLRSFFMSFRLFVLKREPTYLTGIFDLVIKGMTELAPRVGFDKARTEWLQIESGSRGTELFEGDKQIKSLELINLWLSGEYFHSDVDKIERIASWGNFAPVLNAVFLFHVQDITNIIVWLGSYVQKGIEDKWLEVSE